MLKTKSKIITSLLILPFIFLLSSINKGQSVPDYLFLEVLDSKNTPVENAKIEAVSWNSKRSRVHLTNETGKFGFYLPGRNLWGTLTSYFTVSKEGFYTYKDLGGSVRRHRTNAKIELLKIPQNEAERKTLGDEQNKREFLWAAKTGDSESVKKFLKKGIDANLNSNDLRGISGPKNVTAVMFAAMSGDGKTVTSLVKNGANIRSNKEPLKSILIKYLQADPFYWKKPKTNQEKKKIVYEFEKGFEVLVKNGADLNVYYNNTKSPIMIAAEKNYKPIVKLLLKKGFSVNHKDSRGQPLLTYAVGNRYKKYESTNINTVKFLVEQGADSNANCSSALTKASYNGDVEVIRYLLKKVSTINPVCDNRPASPFISAVQGRKVEAAKILIEAGADTTARSWKDKNALEIAADYNDVKMLKLLLNKGLPINQKNKYGWTPLFFALNMSPQIETVETLLKYGADPNVIAEKNYCISPLMMVANNNRLAFLKLLVKYGADVNLRCNNGETALSKALWGRRPEFIKQLVEFGANVNEKKVIERLQTLKNSYKPDSYQRKSVDEIEKILEEAHKKEKR